VGITAALALGRNPEGKLVVWSAKSAMPR